VPAADSRLERELAYYQREVNDLGAKLLRLQEEQQRTFLEAQRSRLVAKMVRELHRLGDIDAAVETLPARVLDVVVSNAMCDRAVLLRERQLGSGVFTLLGEVGLGGETASAQVERLPLRLRKVPPFLFTTGATKREPPASEMVAFLQVPYILWIYDPRSGCALAFGNRNEGNARRPFEAGDHELVETALTIFLDAWVRGANTVALPGHFSMSASDGGSEDAFRGIEGGETLQQRLRRGGVVAGALVVERGAAGMREYVAYLHVSWERGWRVLRTYRDKEDRTYRDLDRLLQHVRDDLGYEGSISLLRSESPELGRFPVVASRERLAAQAASRSR
jgi:hypothetical protein